MSRVSKLVRAERRTASIRKHVATGAMIEVPKHLISKAAGRIYRKELCDPIGGIFDGKLLVQPDWRWERFLAEVA